MDNIIKSEIESYFQENIYSLESSESPAAKIGRREEDIMAVIETLIREEKLCEIIRATETIFASQKFEEVLTSNSESSVHTLARKWNLEEGVLTAREEEVFSLMIQGSNNQELANMLHISENTVKNHVTSIFKKLGVQDRLQLIKRYANYR